MSATIGEYKGSPTINLTNPEDTESKYPFSFGVKKAKMILDNLDAIKKFVEEKDVKKTD